MINYSFSFWKHWNFDMKSLNWISICSWVHGFYTKTEHNSTIWFFWFLILFSLKTNKSKGNTKRIPKFLFGYFFSFPFSLPTVWLTWTTFFEILAQLTVSMIGMSSILDSKTVASLWNFLNSEVPIGLWNSSSSSRWFMVTTY